MAIEYSKNPYEETTLYLVHSILHLIGYNDILKKDKNIMQKKENFYMTFLKKKDLLNFKNSN